MACLAVVCSAKSFPNFCLVTPFGIPVISKFLIDPELSQIFNFGVNALPCTTLYIGVVAAFAVVGRRVSPKLTFGAVVSP